MYFGERPQESARFDPEDRNAAQGSDLRKGRAAAARVAQDQSRAQIVLPPRIRELHHVGEMSALDATSVATLLREFGQRSALRGGNPFRAKAYARAADNLLALSLPLGTIIAQDRLREIPGVGDGIADIIKKLHAIGTHPALEKMRREIPSGVLDMLTPFLRACVPTRSSRSIRSFA